MMPFLFYLKLYALTVPVFFIVDLLWLGVIAKGFYRRQLGFILSPQVNWAAAVIFYLVYIVGILIFAVRPALSQDSMAQSIVLGALYGFFTYATYDLTNMATIGGWPLKIVLVDIAWGAFLCAVVSLAGFIIATKIIA